MKRKMTAEEWLKENCKDTDCDRLMERLSDTMWTRNVIQYMSEYAEYMESEDPYDPPTLRYRDDGGSEQ